MNRKTVIILAMAVVAGAAIGLSVRHARLARAAKVELAAVTRQKESAAIARRRAEKWLEGAELQRAFWQSRLDAVQNPTQLPKSSLTDLAAWRNELAQKWEERLKDPTVQNLELAAQRAILRTKYASFFRALDLPSAQIEKFLDIVLARDEQIADLHAASRAHGLPVEDPAIGEVSSEIDERRLASQRELLGQRQFAQLQEYERTTDLRDLVSRWSGEARMAGVPISPQQAELLTQTLALADKSFGNVSDGRISWGSAIANTDARAIDWDVVATEARSILSDEQFAFIESQINHRAAEMKLAHLLREAEMTDSSLAGNSR